VQNDRRLEAVIFGLAGCQNRNESSFSVRAAVLEVHLKQRSGLGVDSFEDNLVFAHGAPRGGSLRARNSQLAFDDRALGHELNAHINVAAGGIDGRQQQARGLSIVADENEVTKLNLTYIYANAVAGIVLFGGRLRLNQIATACPQGKPNGQNGRNGNANLHDESLQMSGLCGLILGPKITGIPVQL
jgi:hypothetical protein